MRDAYLERNVRIAIRHDVHTCAAVDTTGHNEEGRLAAVIS